MENKTDKPVYFKHSELIADNKIYDYDILQSVELCVGDNVKCLQLDRDLWRIYLTNKESRQKLFREGFQFKNQTVSVYESNPFSSGATSPKDPVLKITVSGIPLSVQDDEIIKMLKHFKVELKSELRYENIRNPATGKMTNVLNGNRFVYVVPLPLGTFLPRIAYCAGRKCRIYHYGQNKSNQEAVCKSCWETGHLARNCQNGHRCKVCKKAGHEPGSEICEFYEAQEDRVVAFHGHKNVLSNFFPAELKVNGETHGSAEHAFQLTKALRNGDINAAERIRAATTALDAKRIGDTVKTSSTWDTEKVDIMSNIIEAKFSQVEPFREKIKKCGSKHVIVEATYDDFWGSGLNEEATLKTKPKAWPGSNTLGKVITAVAKKHCKKSRPNRSFSVPRQPARKASKNTQQEITAFVSQLKDGPAKRSYDDLRTDDDSPHSDSE